PRPGCPPTPRTAPAPPRLNPGRGPGAPSPPPRPPPGPPLPPADAEGGTPEPGVTRRHCMQQRHQDASAAGADGMAERDSTAVHVDPVLRELQLAQDAERLGGEGLVQLPEVDLLLAQASALQRLLRRRPGAHLH